MGFKTIDREVFENEVLPSPRPTLLCFYKNTGPPGETVHWLEELSRQFEAMEFCKVQEEDLEFFFETFHFLGTPFFVLLVNGREQGRLMGTVSADRLRTFVARGVSGISR